MRYHLVAYNKGNLYLLFNKTAHAHLEIKKTIENKILIYFLCNIFPVFK